MGWTIDGRSVEEEAYEAFLATLKTVPGTWYCDDREGGGATGFKAKGPDGADYQVCRDSETGCSIVRMPA